ncbi:hypothetical protein Tco_1005809 [Tanacetum coccineum]|uniref:Uncharacterized protein n=1 Tax=Tanacetum coccineum TaxID=301880 RepID=A0ABQ5FG47_9ASTR
MFMHTARDDSLLGTIRFISRHEDTQELNLQSQKKSDSAISSEESTSKKKPAKKPATKSKPAKKKEPVKADRGKEVPNEQHRKTSGTNEGTGSKPGVPDVPKYDSENESDDGDNDDGDDNDGDGGDNDDGDDNEDDGDNNASDDDNQEDVDKNDDEEETDNEEEHDSERVHTPPEFVSTNDEEKMDDEEDDEVTKELYKDINVNLGNEDAEMTNADQGGADQHNKTVDTSAEFFYKNHEPQTSSLYTVPVNIYSEITSVFTTTIPPPPPFFNPVQQQATPTPTPTTSEATISFPALPDFSFVFKFNDRVTNMEKDLSEMKQVDQYAQALASIPAIVDCYISNQLGGSIQKAKQSHNAECREEALAEKKEGRDEKDKDQDPSAGSDQGTKRKKLSKEAESSRDPKSITVDDTGVQQNQEFNTGYNDEQPANEAASKVDWYKKPERPLTPDPDWNKRQQVDFRHSQTWISKVARAEEPFASFDELMDPEWNKHNLDWNNPEGDRYPFDLSKPLPLQGPLGHRTVVADYFFNNDLEYLKTSDPEVTYTTSTTKTKDARYEIKGIKDMVPTLWSTIKHAEDMLLLAVQHKVFHLDENIIVDFIMALRMFTRSLILKRRVKDLQLGVESYQKKLNITKPQKTFPKIEFKEPYTPLYDPPGIVKEHELYKFSDGTLKSVRDEIHHRVLNFRLDYNTEMPKRKWMAVDRKRSGLMIELIDKQLRQREIIRNLERLVGARELEMDYTLTTQQQDWVQDTDEELEDRELEAHYVYMAKIQEATLVVDEDTGSIFDKEPLEKVDSNITPDSSNMCNYEGKVDHDSAQEKERALLASLIQNMKLEIDESKRVINF